MWKWTGAALVAAMVMFGGSPVMPSAMMLSAMAAEAMSAMPASDAATSGAGARRSHHHQHYAYRPYYPYYLGRPFYYSPGPFFLPDAPSWARRWDQWEWW